ncbi:DUF1963 domain-containing protein [Enterovirga rhinocerotis]|uniref:DUF1963 domain-containing protein n=1 Tax=Enterovirga rhinocerotis TaxID=1339210 RepID=UPI001414FA74|nr:DUF1963 domain-containing protein [Enterovirga rhinocerotis]
MVDRRSLLAWLKALLPAGLLGASSAGGGVLARDASRPPEDKGKRREPLFLSDDDARRIIRDYSVVDGKPLLDDDQIAVLVSRLSEQIWLDASSGDAPPGASRLGGAPDLPKGEAWPVRPALPDLAREAAATHGESNWIARQLAEAVPYEFVGQVDLAEAARIGSAAAGLPSAGRLSFFVDTAVLMSDPEGGGPACRVRHDATPPAGLERLSIPDAFDRMEAWWRAPDPVQIARMEEMAKSLEASGQKEAAAAIREVARSSSDPDDTQKKPFVHPARPVRLTALKVLPSRGTLELERDKMLGRIADGETTREVYSLLTSNDAGPFSADAADMRVTQPWLMREARRNRLMGPADPEQDDPRYSAIPATERAAYPWDAEATAAMSEKADRWRLLLQISIADLSQMETEGTLYFVIARDDLDRRDFSRVRVVYQQT